MGKVTLPSIRELAVGLPEPQPVPLPQMSLPVMVQIQPIQPVRVQQQIPPMMPVQVPLPPVPVQPPPLPQQLPPQQARQQHQPQLQPQPEYHPIQVTLAHNIKPPPPKKKRPRRKANEMVRLYACNYNNCKNSYGTLNHLNAHITFKRHGPKRKPEEFKQIRELYKLQKTQDKNKILDTLGDKTELPVFHQQRGYNGYGRHDHTLNKKELEKLA